MKPMIATDQSFLDLLVTDGVVSRTDASRVDKALESSEQGRVILLSSLGILPEALVLERLAKFLNLSVCDVGAADVDSLLESRLGRRFLSKAGILPLSDDGTQITIATADPFDSDTINAIGLATSRSVAIRLSRPSRIGRALTEALGEPTAERGAVSNRTSQLVNDAEKLRELAAEAPVIRYVSETLMRASEARASDIHFETSKTGDTVRFRIDGVLREVPAPNLSREAIISRLKVLASLDISERRLPQDGRIKTTIAGEEIDLRLSTYPTLHGESAVIRLLDQSASAANLNQIGMSFENLALYRERLDRPAGIVLVTGPTGSGKTTTLYGSLKELATSATKVFTIEDPIEYELPGVNQCQVKPKIGFSFATALRSLLRQDPDVILVGEIRDSETAEMCAQAALTGHKVFSSIHTIDAVATVTRLIDLGVPSYLIADTVDTIVAQRLVRRLCEACKREVEVPADIGGYFLERKLQAPTRIFIPVGCTRCNQSGYTGRIGIYEVLALNDTQKDAIRSGDGQASFRRSVLAGGFQTMFDDGLNKVKAGITSMAEVLRTAQRS